MLGPFRRFGRVAPRSARRLSEAGVAARDWFTTMAGKQAAFSWLPRSHVRFTNGIKSLADERIWVSMVALAPSMEERVVSFCRRARLQDLDIRLSHWDGHMPDVAIVNLDDPYGRYIHELVLGRKARIMAIATPALMLNRWADAWASPGLPSAEFDELLTGLLMRPPLPGPSPAESAVPRPMLPGIAGLLGIAALQVRSQGWVAISSDAGRFIVSPAASRIRAESPAQMLAAQRSLLEPVWSSGQVRFPVGRPYVEKSLDLFFLEACLLLEAELPPLADIQFRLAHWPDLGGQEPRYPWVLRTAGAIARQAPVAANRIAQQLPLKRCRVNALFWALWASGVLEAGTGCRPATNGEPGKALPVCRTEP